MANGSERSRTAFRGAWILCAGVACAVLLNGCTGAAASVRDSVSTALKDSSSAVATDRLALGLHAADSAVTRLVGKKPGADNQPVQTGPGQVDIGRLFVRR